MFKKLIDADRRPQEYSLGDSGQRHFNSYFNLKKQSERIQNENLGMMERMMNQSSIVPTL